MKHWQHVSKTSSIFIIFIIISRKFEIIKLISGPVNIPVHVYVHAPDSVCIYLL